MKEKNISCEIIRDLLPLYEDACCSEATQTLVEEHLKSCESCRQQSERYNQYIHINSTKEIPDPDVKAIQKGYRRIRNLRRRTWALIIILAICIAVVGLLYFNQQRGKGLGFCNLYRICQVNDFLNAIESEDYEKAYASLNVRLRYDDLLENHSDDIDDNVQNLKEKGYDWYDDICYTAFVAGIEDWQAQGLEIVKHRLYFAASMYNGSQIVMTVTFSNGKNAELEFTADQTGIISWNQSYFDFTLCDEILELLYQDTDYDWTVLKGNSREAFIQELH